jgi:hypothetical protein
VLDDGQVLAHDGLARSAVQRKPSELFEHSFAVHRSRCHADEAEVQRLIDDRSRIDEKSERDDLFVVAVVVVFVVELGRSVPSILQTGNDVLVGHQHAGADQESRTESDGAIGAVAQMNAADGSRAARADGQVVDTDQIVSFDDPFEGGMCDRRVTDLVEQSAKTLPPL